MKVKVVILPISILLIPIVFVFMNSAHASTPSGTICYFGPPHCLGSPSGWCVLDEDTKNMIKKCAVGCYDTSGPAGGAFCSYGPFKCTFYGFYDFSCYRGFIPVGTPTVQCSVAEWVGHENLSDCRLKCAAECGRMTLLTDDCENCTISDMCHRYHTGTYEEMACNNTCSGVCESNRQFCDVIELLRYTAMFVGIIMLILHGFKWLVSEDMEGRKDAKRGMVYVMVGLALMVLTSALVELMFFKTLIC